MSIFALTQIAERDTNSMNIYRPIVVAIVSCALMIVSHAYAAAVTSDDGARPRSCRRAI